MSRALIVGGGLVGLLTARALHARGLDVIVVERGRPAHEASWAGGGILSPLYPWRFPDAVTALALASAPAWPALARTLRARSGVDPEHRPGGMLVIDDDDPAEVSAWAERHGVRLLPLDRATVADREPGLVVPPGYPWLLRDVASIRSPRLLRAASGAVRADGIDLREGVAARAVVTAGQRAIGVETDAGRIMADTIVICAGAWSGPLLAGLGVEPPGIRPVRGQMLAFNAGRDRLGHVVLTRGRYLIPRRDGVVLAGSTLEEAGFDDATTPEVRTQLLAFARGLMPELADAPLAGHWAGLRPGSDDGVPTIAPHPAVTGLWTNVGHHRNGIVTAPASADLLADLVSGAEPALDPAPYAWPPA